MKDLEQYIKENKELFNNGELPMGHQTRFQLKLQEQKPHKQHKTVTFTYKTATAILMSVAALFIIAFILGDLSKKEPAQTISVTIMNPDIYSQQMKHEEEEVIQMSKQLNERTEEQVLATLDNITFEAIPLAEQLPKELSDTERAKILQDYYKQKTEGIKKIKRFLAQELSDKE